MKMTAFVLSFLTGLLALFRFYINITNIDEMLNSNINVGSLIPLVSFFYLIFGLLLLVGSIGGFMNIKWARKLALVSSGAITIFFLMESLFLFAILGGLSSLLLFYKTK